MASSFDLHSGQTFVYPPRFSAALLSLFFSYSFIRSVNNGARYQDQEPRAACRRRRVSVHSSAPDGHLLRPRSARRLQPGRAGLCPQSRTEVGRLCERAERGVCCRWLCENQGHRGTCDNLWCRRAVSAQRHRRRVLGTGRIWTGSCQTSSDTEWCCLRSRSFTS